LDLAGSAWEFDAGADLATAGLLPMGIIQADRVRLMAIIRRHFFMGVFLCEIELDTEKPGSPDASPAGFFP
jgi:hypothetical protein